MSTKDDFQRRLNWSPQDRRTRLVLADSLAERGAGPNSSAPNRPRRQGALKRRKSAAKKSKGKRKG